MVSTSKEKKLGNNNTFSCTSKEKELIKILLACSKDIRKDVPEESDTFLYKI